MYALFFGGSRAHGNIIIALGQKGHGLGLVYRQLAPGCGLGLGKAQPGDQGLDLQLGKQFGGSGRVTGLACIAAGGGFNGGLAHNGAQCAAQFGLGLVGIQLGAHAGLDARIVNMRIHTVQRAEILHKHQGSFFADSGHTRDIIAGIAHQAFHFDQLAGLYAVFFAHGLGVHGNGFLVGGQQNGGGFAGQLQAVPVSRGQQAIVLAGGAGGGQRAQNIISLPALAAYAHKAQIGQKLLEHRHLLGKLGRHTVARGFIAIVHFVAEGRGLQIPRNSHFIGLVRFEQVQKNIHKAVNGVGKAAILGGEHFDAEKGTVHQTVAV